MCAEEWGNKISPIPSFLQIFNVHRGATPTIGGKMGMSSQSTCTLRQLCPETPGWRYRTYIIHWRSFLTISWTHTHLFSPFSRGKKIALENLFWIFGGILLLATHVQIVYLRFERLWNFAREMVAPIWSLNKVFILKNLVMKSFQKIWSKSTRKRRPRGSSIKHGEIWPAKLGQMRLPQIFQVHLLHLSELSTLFFTVDVNGTAVK